MPTPITDRELDNLLKFIGYGSLDASTWFLGKEEAGAGEEALRIRASFQAVEDCAEAHKKLGIEKHHWGRKVLQPTWRGMCYIMLALQGQDPTREVIRNYQADFLGRRHGSTLLMELMPIPRPKAEGWRYGQFIPQFADEREYFEIFKPRRIACLHDLIAERKPEVVIGYGKDYWSDFEELFDGIEFLMEDELRVGANDNTVVILTRHFTSKEMNGKLDSVVSLIQSERRRIEH